ncbi:MAG TPA: hypothetical protein VMV49_11355 [Candidatus Deferrimicrobium sp.]|nr:hypothetical protein [Candidatus Deferrimicrobium sp.]
MVSTKLKGLIIIACIITGVISVLLAPIQIATYKGTDAIDYSTTVQQINLVADIESSNIFIEYATEPDADLINITYLYTIRHSMLISAPNITVTLDNSTLGTVLTVLLTIRFPWLIFSTIGYTKTIITINPSIISNLSIRVDTGNIYLNSTNYQNKTYVNIDLLTASGNVEADIVEDSNILGYLYAISISGNADLMVDDNVYIGGPLCVNTSSGNVDITLNENVTLNSKFISRTLSGNIIFRSNNISLNNNEIKSYLLSTSGNIEAIFYQWLEPTGNLSLKIDIVSGNIRLTMRLEDDYISSQINTSTPSGTTTIALLHTGYNIVSENLISTTTLSSNFDADLETNSGNIYISATRT